MSDSYYDLGNYSRQVTTSSPEAQVWFNRGLLWTYCFNPEEAVRCFQKAVQYDPHCAMAHWGIAFASGPNYNKAWSLFDRIDLENTLPLAHAALETARMESANATPFERDLIDALGSRFPAMLTQDPEEFHKLNMAYVEAMRSFYQKYSDDLDASALFGDALICVSPRKLWDLDSGEPIGYGTLEARTVIEEALLRTGGDQHPVLNHLYIHLMEMSPYPEVALKAADHLRRLCRDGSHLAHMSTHIDNACGDWRRVVDSNLDAADADDRYFAQEKKPGAWYTYYRAHNLMVGTYGAMMAGKSREAISFARRLNKVITSDFLRLPNPDRRLLANMQVVLSIEITTPADILTVPVKAILGESGEQFVFVRSGSNFERRSVKLGAKFGNDREVLKGVFPDEEVVTVGNYQLQFAKSAEPKKDEHKD